MAESIDFKVKNPFLWRKTVLKLERFMYLDTKRSVFMFTRNKSLLLLRGCVVLGAGCCGEIQSNEG